MNSSQPLSYSRCDRYGHEAVEALRSLIAEAVRSSDEERIAVLNQILHNVESLIQLAQGRQSANAGVHERQAPFYPAFAHSGTSIPTAAPSIGDPAKIDIDALTSREKQIIGHLAEGDANKVIANKLGITEATVKVHIKTILRKLGLKNRTQAALCAVQRGWLNSA